MTAYSGGVRGGTFCHLSLWLSLAKAVEEIAFIALYPFLY